jgi:hypothetical protein
MKVNEPSKEMLLDAHETHQQADIKNADHQFGKESLYIIYILIDVPLLQLHC